MIPPFSSAVLSKGKFMLLAMLLILLATLTGCGGAPEYLYLGVDADPDANNNAPISVAVVVVYNAELDKELSHLPASKWFEEMAQRERDNPEESNFKLCKWELMPGQKIPEKKVHLQGKEAKGIIFADYFSDPFTANVTDNPHRLRFLVNEKRYLIRLHKDKVELEIND